MLDGALGRASVEIGLRGLPPPVPPALGRDHAQVARTVRQRNSANDGEAWPAW